MALKLDELRMRDPFLLEVSPSEFLIFGTTDENLWGGPATGFNCYRSPDLQTWEGPIAAFRPGDDFWADTQFWAPEVHRYQGKYFMFATFAKASETERVRGTAILVADDPAGPYQPWSDGPVTPTNLPCLDGTFYLDKAGVPWIVYSRGAEGIPGGAPGIADGEMYARQLSPDLKSAAGEPILLFHSSSASWSKPLWFPPGVTPPEQLNLAKDPLFTDGAFLVEAENGALHMLWSAYGDEGYAMGFATSSSGSVLGPWVQSNQPIWPKNGGHGMILRRCNGEDLMVFHHPNDTPNERPKIVPVLIDSSGISMAPAANL